MKWDFIFKEPQAVWIRRLVFFVLLVHSGLLIGSAWIHSPLVDEPAHLAAGLSHWKRFSFDLYRVNPPLVRMVAAFPLLFVPHHEDWSSYSDDLYKRAEFRVGKDFIQANPERYRLLLFLARCFCIPLSVLGGIVCYRFASDLFGRAAGLFAVCLWCFSPMILAFGYLVMPDVGSAALGIFALYRFYRWLCVPDRRKACIAGLALGLAELSKFTLLLLYPLLFVLWGIRLFINRNNILQAEFRNQLGQFLCLQLLSVLVIHLGYGFEGSFIPLKDYEFVSRALCGNTKWNNETGFTPTGNRFRGTWAGLVPVPVPANFLLGIDVQKKDFEIGRESYFLGQWSRKGWYSYYLVGLLIKEPLGFWCLFSAACFVPLFFKAYRTTVLSESVLLIPVLVLFLVVSSQTKLNHHLRYMIPVLPLLFVFASRLGRPVTGKAVYVTIISWLLLGGCIGSSLFVYPHSQTYFNRLIGPIHNGPAYLLGSNIDWGQNLFLLEKWCETHPEVSEICVYYEEGCAIPLTKIPLKENRPTQPEPGWYAVGVNDLYEPNKQLEWLKDHKPYAIIGNTIYVYWVKE